MGWDTFWAPNILQATLFAAISGLVSAVVVFFTRRIVLRWLQEIFGEQQRTTNAAEAAASRASEALDASHQAVATAASTSDDAKTAADNSRQANDAVLWLAEQLAVRDAANTDLKERVDRLLGTRARKLATERDDEHPPGLLVPYAAGEAGDATTVTGRHRLHTQYIPTTDEGDHP